MFHGYAKFILPFAFRFSNHLQYSEESYRTQAHMHTLTYQVPIRAHHHPRTDNYAPSFDILRHLMSPELKSSIAQLIKMCFSSLLSFRAYSGCRPQKLWWQHVWPCLQQEMRTSEVLAAVLQPALSLVAESTTDEYEKIILPTFR